MCTPFTQLTTQIRREHGQVTESRELCYMGSGNRTKARSVRALNADQYFLLSVLIIIIIIIIILTQSVHDDLNTFSGSG